MTVTVLPDVERLVSVWLRAHAEVSGSVVTAIPRDPSFPLVRLVRVGGAPVTQRPLHVDRATLQIDVWGGPKQTAQDLAQTVRGAIAQLEGTAQPEGVVSAVDFGPFQYLPDQDFEPARPRYQFDVDLTVHP